MIERTARLDQISLVVKPSDGQRLRVHSLRGSGLRSCGRVHRPLLQVRQVHGIACDGASCARREILSELQDDAVLDQRALVVAVWQINALSKRKNVTRMKPFPSILVGRHGGWSNVGQSFSLKVLQLAFNHMHHFCYTSNPYHTNALQGKLFFNYSTTQAMDACVHKLNKL